MAREYAARRRAELAAVDPIYATMPPDCDPHLIEHGGYLCTTVEGYDQTQIEADLQARGKTAALWVFRNLRDRVEILHCRTDGRVKLTLRGVPPKAIEQGAVAMS